MKRGRVHIRALIVACLVAGVQFGCNTDARECATSDDCESRQTCRDGHCVSADESWRAGGSGGNGSTSSPSVDAGGMWDDASGSGGAGDASSGGDPGEGEGSEERCDDGDDGDGDGRVDCADSDCLSGSSCTFASSETDCGDDLDGDGDGRIDCADSDCSGGRACGTESNCTDGKDDDRDGLIDCDDGDCAGSACGHILTHLRPRKANFQKETDLTDQPAANIDEVCQNRNYRYGGQWKAVMSASGFSAKRRIRVEGEMYYVNLHGRTNRHDLIDETGGSRFWDPSRSLKNDIAAGLEQPQEVWTGSKPGGARAPGSTCNGWESTDRDSTANVGMIGPDPPANSTQLGGESRSCSDEHRVLCVSGQKAENCKSPGDEDRDGVEDCRDPDCRFAHHCHQYMFATDDRFQGDFGGLKQADSICQKRGEKLDVPHSDWRAVLSVDSTSARDRIDQNRPYVIGLADLAREGYVAVASPAHDLFSRRLRNGSDYTSTWTGATADGGSHTANCSGWTAQQGEGMSGETSRAWLEARTRNCSRSLSLYCISGQN